jgi:hypothetical protein
VKKAPLFITIGVVALSVAGYFVYENYFLENKLTPWDLVPQGAVAVYEASSCDECVEPVKETSIWEIIMKAALYRKQQDSLQNIVSILERHKTGSLASLHVTKKDDFDFIFYVPALDKNEKILFEATIEEWKNKPGLRYAQREFNATVINELSTSGSVFSWTFLDDIWVGSFTPFLIEDVIRVYGSGKEAAFRESIAGVYQLPKLKNDAGNLYVHLKNFSRWLSIFSPTDNLELIQDFGKAAVLDIKAAEKNLVLNGFSIGDAHDGSVLSVFNGQSPTSFGIKQVVSNRTVVLATYGISEGADFGAKLGHYPERKKVFEDTLSQLSRSLKVNIRDLYASVNNEVGVCYVESAGQHLSRVLIVETDKSDDWMNTLNTLAEKLSIDTVFFEPYSGYEIRQLPLFRFPEKIFAPFVQGFDQTYYTSVGNTIIIGEDLEQLKLFLEDIDREETWGKSVMQNRFLESTLLESNVSLYINTPRIWNVLGGSLNEKWNDFIRENNQLLADVGMGAVQFSHLNESFYTNVSWQYEQPELPEPGSTPENETIIAGFQSGLSGKPFVVRSHIDKSNEVLLQDSTSEIHLVSKKGNVLWSLPMNGPIIGEVFQVDYYKNGKLQYFFATEGRLHIIDRLGNYVQPFPIEVKAKAIEYVSLIDYDHSKNYRFLIADKSGRIWMYNKEVTNLEGWNAKNIENEMFAAPRHFRIRGKDYIAAIRRDGKAYVMNRRGEPLKGFPLNLDARPTGDYFLEVGNRSDNTYFVVVSRDGFRIKFNLEGKIQSRETLIKSTVNAQFGLIKEHSGKSYCMIRQEANGLTVIDSEGKEIVTNQYIGMNPVEVQFFDFGAGRLYYTITDKIQNLTYVYDRLGQLLASPPLESYFCDLQPLKSEKVTVYLTYQRSLIIKSLF